MPVCFLLSLALMVFFLVLSVIEIQIAVLFREASDGFRRLCVDEVLVTTFMPGFGTFVSLVPV
jgi:hypothetical protein